MIPIQNNRVVHSGGVEGSAEFGISEKDTAHLMQILRDTLYSDKVLAVLREYGANAWDAQRSNNKGHLPIKITLPTYSEPTLKIRDFGPGLSLEDVFEVYNKYGASTKRDSNVAVGMLGIGSKSGFAYSDSFTIVSWHGGQMSTYVAVIDSSEKGRVDLFDVQPAEDPNETGVEIQIAVRPHDIAEFERKAQALFAFYEPQPDINCVLPEPPKGKDFPGLGRVLESQDGQSMRGAKGITAVMGCVPYRVNLGQLTGLSKYANSISAILWFDIGQLQVAASREELKYGDTTKDRLTERINTIIDKYVEHLLDGVDKLSPWERRLRVAKINELYLPIPLSLKGYDDRFVNFDKSPDFSLKHLGYRGKIEGYYGIPIKESTRILFRNEKRLLQGYALQANDIIVEPTLDERKARLTFADMLKKHNLVGIPQANISTVTWTRPETGPRSPVDAARAKAQCLILDVKNIGADRKSERWTPVSRVPQATDVYVVLDSYAVGNLTDFYETYQSDAGLLSTVNLTMPQIIGYRNTQAHPVDRSKLKGSDYRVWRDKGMVDFIVSVSGVKESVSAKVWADISAYGVYLADIVKNIGQDHPISRYVEKVLNGHVEYKKTNRNIYEVVSRAYYTLRGKEPETEWAEIVKSYPLFGTQGSNSISFLSVGSANGQLWIDYIKMVDLHRELSENMKNADDSEQENAA